MDSFDLYSVYKPIESRIERQPATYKPFMFGNQCFIVAEQIIQNIQETLSLKIGMVTPSGEVILIDPSQHGTLISVLLNHLLSQQPANVAALPSPPTPATRPNEPIPNTLLENCRYFRSSNCNCQPKFLANRQNWSNRNSPLDIPLQHIPTCSKSTSCSELATHFVGTPVNQRGPTQTELPTNLETHEIQPSFAVQCPFCNKLSAREQVLLRKLLTDHNFLYDSSTA